VNQSRNRVDQYLNIYRVEFLLRRRHGAHHTPPTDLVHTFAISREFDVSTRYNRLIFKSLRLALHLPYMTAIVMSARSPMLRITRKANGEVVFRVSGQLTAENVAEIETLLTAEGKDRGIVLDCTDLRSVDGEAVRFLEKWEGDSIKLKNCGLYIREWIRRQRLERQSAQSSETSE
jgi:anti-anti-sigma regulatory factor